MIPMTPPAVAVQTTRVRPRRHRQSVAVLVSRKPAKATEADVSAEFADAVAQAIDGPVLRYSQRQVLVRDAERRGIGRFEANLIIAAVQHRLEREHARSLPVQTECFKRIGKWWPAVVMVLVVETTLSFAAWWTMRV